MTSNRTPGEAEGTTGVTVSSHWEKSLGWSLASSDGYDSGESGHMCWVVGMPGWSRHFDSEQLALTYATAIALGVRFTQAPTIDEVVRASR